MKKCFVAFAVLGIALSVSAKEKPVSGELKIAAPVTIRGDVFKGAGMGDRVVFTGPGEVVLEDVAFTGGGSVLFRDCKVTAKNVEFSALTAEGERNEGGAVVALEGACGGSSFTGCRWVANLSTFKASTAYARKAPTSDLNAPLTKVLSSGCKAGACLLDLTDDGTVAFRDCTFAYNATDLGWCAGLNARAGRATVDGCTFWGNVMNGRWGVFADLLCGFRSGAKLSNSLFAKRGERFFDANDPLVEIGDGMRYGDPGFGTKPETFVSEWLSYYPDFYALDPTNFPIGICKKTEFGDCAHRGGEVRFALKSKAVPDVAPTAKIKPEPKPASAWADWSSKLKPGLIVTGPAEATQNRRVDYKFMAGQHARGSCTQGNRSLLWYRHLDDPAWGRTYDAVRGKGVPLDPDYFALSKPVDGDHEGRPLLVCLHGRGGGANGFYNTWMGGTDGCYGSPDDFYAIALDCRDNCLNDFWWGAMPPGTPEAGCTVGDILGNFNNTYWSFVGGGALYGELNIGPTFDPFQYHKTSCLDWCLRGEPPVAKRVLDTIEWVVRKYGIDRNRIYLAGNSMGGQGALAIGLTHGEVFAAINGNVPATIVYPVARMGFVGADGRDVPAESYAAPEFDPPVVFDWSGSNDAWSRDHDVLYRNMNRFKFQFCGYWGDYGHCGSYEKAREKNDLIAKTFDWFSIKKNEAYPVFTDASCNDRIPWPQIAWQDAAGTGGKIVNGIETAKGAITPCEGSDLVGQWNGWFRWEIVKDTPDELAVKLWIPTEEELPATILARPAKATANVSMRRLQQFKPGESGRWTFGSQKGAYAYDAKLKTFTAEGIEITQKPETLSFKKK